MSSDVRLKAHGLNKSPNILDTPPGSLSKASNVVIRRDNVIEPRRGFKVYGDTLGTSSDRANQLAIYRTRILRHFNETLEFDDGSGNFSAFSGSYAPTANGLRIKSVQSNGNFYFTTDDGIKKISAANGSGLTSNSGYITNAGGVKALDIDSKLNITLGSSSGFLPVDSTVAYRQVWGITDANNVPHLGTPSQRTEIYNSLLSMVIRDYMRVLGALDNISSSMISDADYVNSLKLPISGSAVSLQTDLVSLATKIDQDILYANDSGTGAPLNISAVALSGTVCTITFSSGTATNYFSIGSKIYLAGFTTFVSGTINGAQVVTSVAAGNITFNSTATGGAVNFAAGTIVSNEYRSIPQPAAPSTPATNTELTNLQIYLDNIIVRLQAEPTAVISLVLSNAYIVPLDITTSCNVDVDISIPTEVTTSHFYQLYRSNTKTATTTDVLSELIPDDEMRLVYEGFPTQSQIDAGLVTVTDIVPDEFYSKATNLYTNENSGEGILQANDVPPFAKDVNRFKNNFFFANTKTRHRKNLFLLGVTQIIEDFDSNLTPRILIANSEVSNEYCFKKGKQEVTTITCGTKAATPDGGYFTLNSGNNTKGFYVWYDKSGSAVDPSLSSKIGIKVDIQTATTADDVAKKTRDAIALQVDYFTSSEAVGVVTVTNVTEGPCDDVTLGAGMATALYSSNVTIQGQGENLKKKQQKITTVADVAGNLAGTAFTIDTAFEKELYYIWFKVNGSGIDPAIANRTGVRVDIATNATNTTVATAIGTALTNLGKFSVSVNSNHVTVTDNNFGPCTSAADALGVPCGFTYLVIEEGALDVLLSNLVSPSLAADATAKSLVRAINKNSNESVYAYYLSGSTEPPGSMLFESRNLSNPQFYVVGTSTKVGTSFSPTISPDHSFGITNITNGVITLANHGYHDGDQVLIVCSDAKPRISGLYTIFNVSTNAFSVSSDGDGLIGSVVSSANAESSDNEVKPNRIYYSKEQQPEAVPILNYLDVGTENSEIIRIFPLRDSLFVFKKEGIYRITGEVAPFTQSLFDSSCILAAPDSIGVSNNYIYAWSESGIVKISEATPEDISSNRIDIDIQKLSSSNYPHFTTSTWGVGYDSDNSYLVFTVSETSDTVATIGYRYSNLTNTWTTYDKTSTCGIVNSEDNKLYLGAGDINSIEVERKTFTRLDYADREISSSLLQGNLSVDGLSLRLASVSGINIGDVVTQDQTLTVYKFNSLLRKLDNDLGVSDQNYFSLLGASNGVDLRIKLSDSDPAVGLAAKLDADSGVSDNTFLSSIDSKTGSVSSNTAAVTTVITTSSPHGLETNRIVSITGSNCVPPIDGTYVVTKLSSSTFSIPVEVLTAGSAGTYTTVDNDFDDIKACFNIIISKLNDDSSVVFSNYMSLDNETLQEAIITEVSPTTSSITLNLALPWVVGDLTIFKAIETEVIYNPVTMGDVLGLKHLREATVMFEDRQFTSATLSFATDLLPGFNSIIFNGSGNGTFGNRPYGSGFFGGISNSAPMRTYIPRNCQRCRYIIPKFNHRTAREKYAILGITITGEVGQSSRAYR